MRKSRFTEEQIVKIVREADRMAVPEVAKRHGVSEATLYRWKKRLGDMNVDEANRLKQLEQENARLKKMVAERDLELEVMRKSAQKNGERVLAPATGRENLGWILTPEALKTMPFMFRMMMKANTIYIADGPRKVNDKTKVASHWKTILSWPASTVMTYHDPPGVAFSGDGRAALEAAARKVKQVS